MISESSVRGRRIVEVGLLIGVALAAVGFFTGTGGVPVRGGYHPAAGAPAQSGHATPAPKQRDMAQYRYRERGAAQQLALAALREPPRSPLDPVVLDPASYARAVSARSTGRAYDGAPPTIPHAVDQRGVPACLTCHGEGMRVEGKVAHPLSHAPLSNCLQCHTTRAPALALREALPASVAEQTTFLGLAGSGRGERAWPGAPPQLPHKSFMRERCTSCHGVWAEGLASSHAARTSCTQCHTPAATADQTPRSVFSALGVSEQQP